MEATETNSESTETDTETEVQEKESKFKSRAITAGKVALSIVSPPIGLAAWGKKGFGYRAVRFGVGLALSVYANGVILSQGYPTESLYDNPNVSVSNREFNHPFYLAIPEMLLTPFQFLDTHSATYSNTEKGVWEFGVIGDDVVNFDKSQGKYTLNFSHERQFRTQEGELVSVVGARNKLNSLAQKQQTLEQKGDILGARSTSTELAAAKNAYDDTLHEYALTQSFYEDAVEKMNTDLKGLAIKRKELTGDQE